MCLHSGPFSRTSGLYVQVPSWLSIRCLIGHLKLSRSNTELLPLPAPCSTHNLLCNLSHLSKDSAILQWLRSETLPLFLFFHTYCQFIRIHFDSTFRTYPESNLSLATSQLPLQSKLPSLSSLSWNICSSLVTNNPPSTIFSVWEPERFF